MSNNARISTSTEHQAQQQEVPLHNGINQKNSFSELFELKAKPKLTCIPSHHKQLFDLRKTQSLNVTKVSEYPEKSFSVLYIGHKNNGQRSNRYVM